MSKFRRFNARWKTASGWPCEVDTRPPSGPGGRPNNLNLCPRRRRRGPTRFAPFVSFGRGDGVEMEPRRWAADGIPASSTDEGLTRPLNTSAGVTAAPAPVRSQPAGEGNERAGALGREPTSLRQEAALRGKHAPRLSPLFFDTRRLILHHIRGFDHAARPLDRAQEQVLTSPERYDEQKGT